MSEKEMYCPEFSDISDDELVSATQQAEQSFVAEINSSDDDVLLEASQKYQNTINSTVQQASAEHQPVSISNTGHFTFLFLKEIYFLVNN